MKRQTDALTKAGLITTTDSRYVPTPKGEAVLHPGADKFLGGTDICFAKRAVVKIVGIAAPADTGGVRASRVTYDYTLKDVAPWAGDPAVAAVFPEIGRMLGTPNGQTTDVLVQTTNGWKHERDTR
ncbi:hypothetical protein [Telmatospirillum sp.]|uniref:hypothetical protein n=1 Tax=Telmatospirillum sp. TaxID=2079197 RepID=UPI00283D21D2|nr:hypothetical protein [Telmatospirillum sp.]MDR3439916.1 hypothetical protein [Telmatospirillum sp.]